MFDTVGVTDVDQGPPAGATAAGPKPRTGAVEFVLLVIGAEVCRHLDVPLRAAGVLFAGAAIVVGSWLLRRRGPLRRHARSTGFVALGLALAGVLLIWHVALLAVQPFVGDYEQCVERALTREARQSCQDDLQNRLGSLGPG